MFTFNIQNWNPVGMPLHNKDSMDGAMTHSLMTSRVETI